MTKKGGNMTIKDVLFSLGMIMLKGNIVRDLFRFYVRCFASLNMTKKSNMTRL